jgi:hypothetical protein
MFKSCDIEEIVKRVKEEMKILHIIKTRKVTGLVISCVETAFWKSD